MDLFYKVDIYTYAISHAWRGSGAGYYYTKLLEYIVIEVFTYSSYNY